MTFHAERLPRPGQWSNRRRPSIAGIAHRPRSDVYMTVARRGARAAVTVYRHRSPQVWPRATRIDAHTLDLCAMTKLRPFRSAPLQHVMRVRAVEGSLRRFKRFLP